MEAKDVSTANLQDQSHAKAGLIAATPAIEKRTRFQYEGLRQICGTGLVVDSFDFHSFDWDARALDDNDDDDENAAFSSCSLGDGCLEERPVSG